MLVFVITECYDEVDPRDGVMTQAVNRVMDIYKKETDAFKARKALMDARNSTDVHGIYYSITRMAVK